MSWSRHPRGAGVVAAIAMVVSAGVAARGQNLVGDPNFTASGAAGTFTDGWLISSQNEFGPPPGLRTSMYGWPTYESDWAVAFGSPPPSTGGANTISQSIPTTPGTSYTVSFWLDSFFNTQDVAGGQGFSANFGNGSISTDTTLTAYTLESFTAQATATTTTLNLGGFDYLDSGYYMLDDVSVVAAAAVPTVAMWVNPGSGDWNVAANWSPGVPNGIGAEADFLGSILAPSTVTSSSAVTLGTIRFNNANSYLLAGSGSLTMQTSSGSALIDVQGGAHTIHLPLTLVNNTTLETDSASAGLVIAGPLTLDSSVTLLTTGSGTVTYTSTITLDSGAAMSFASSTSAAALTLNSSAMAVVSSTSGTRTCLQLGALSLAPGATLDLTDNDLLVHGGSLSGISSLIDSGYRGSSPWTGDGITSSAAASDTTHLTALGVMQPSSATTIDGQAVGTGDVFVKYTYYGDANLDGRVDASDYSLIDNGYLNHLTGWQNGDFNYDGVVNGSDYTLTDNAFNMQGAQLDSQMASPSAGIAEQIAGAGSVPEPGVLCLGGAGAVAMLGRRRRDRA